MTGEDSIDVKITAILGKLDVLDTKLDGNIHNLEGRVAGTEADLHNHVHHPNPHPEQETWLRRLVDHRDEVSQKRITDGDRAILERFDELVQELKEMKTEAREVKTRTDQQDGALRVIKWILGAVATITTGSTATIIATKFASK